MKNKIAISLLVVVVGLQVQGLMGFDWAPVCNSNFMPNAFKIKKQINVGSRQTVMNDPVVQAYLKIQEYRQDNKSYEQLEAQYQSKYIEQQRLAQEQRIFESYKAAQELDNAGYYLNLPCECRCMQDAYNKAVFYDAQDPYHQAVVAKMTSDRMLRDWHKLASSTL